MFFCAHSDDRLTFLTVRLSFVFTLVLVPSARGSLKSAMKTALVSVVCASLDFCLFFLFPESFFFPLTRRPKTLLFYPFRSLSLSSSPLGTRIQQRKNDSGIRRGSRERERETQMPFPLEKEKERHKMTSLS